MLAPDLVQLPIPNVAFTSMMMYAVTTVTVCIATISSYCTPHHLMTSLHVHVMLRTTKAVLL